MDTNKESIDNYILLKQNKNLSKQALKQYRSVLNVFNEKVKKPFKEVQEKDILKYLSNYNTPQSKNTRIIVLKNFYRYIYKLDKEEKLPDCIRRIELAIEKKDNIKYRERVITEEEYQKMIICCTNPKQKAILETMYNFGVRKSELLSIKLRDVKYNGHETEITVRESKTKTRDSIYQGRSKHLLNWTETLFPYKDDKDHYVFFSSKNHEKPYVPETLNHMIITITKRAGIKRRISPHDFRHTSITNARNNGIPEAHIETNHGLVHGSRQIKTYDHNKTKDFKEWLRKRAIETKPTYELLEEQKKTLEEKHQKEIDMLKLMMLNLGYKEEKGKIYQRIPIDEVEKWEEVKVYDPKTNKEYELTNTGKYKEKKN